MDARYTFDVLPLDTPDEDPRWETYANIFRTVFLSSRAVPEGVATFRRHRRADAADLGMVTTSGPGLDGEQIVAACNSNPGTLNGGRGLAPTLVINTIGVLPSHRRRGILKEMLGRQLTSGHDRGYAYAVLTASEATIYGRFGFGVATRWQEWEIDARRFGLRQDLEGPEGTIEFVHPAFLEPHWERIVTAHQAAHRGAVGHFTTHRLVETGAWDSEAGAPSKDLRAIVHFDAEGTADGFALFKFKGWDEAPKAQVVKVCAAQASVERVLWGALASMDLIEKLTFEGADPDSPLPLSLADPRAIKVTGAGDWVWLRILDLPRAVESRAFDGTGEVTVAIRDSWGFINGTWRLSAHDGVGAAILTDAEPEVVLSAETLASAWLGDRRPTEQAKAGLVTGTDDAIRRLTEILHWNESAVSIAPF